MRTKLFCVGLYRAIDFPISFEVSYSFGFGGVTFSAAFTILNTSHVQSFGSVPSVTALLSISVAVGMRTKRLCVGLYKAIMPLPASITLNTSHGQSFGSVPSGRSALLSMLLPVGMRTKRLCSVLYNAIITLPPSTTLNTSHSQLSGNVPSGRSGLLSMYVPVGMRTKRFCVGLYRAIDFPISFEVSYSFPC